MSNKIPKILFIARDDGGCGFFRCSQPANFLNRSGLAEAKSVMRNIPIKEILSYDLVIIQNVGGVDGAGTIQELARNKIPYIVEFDDFVHHVSPHNGAGYPAWNPSTLFVYRAMEATRSANALTVSTNQLAREYFPYNQSIYVVPNYLDEDKWTNPTIKRDDGKIRIGWAGGNAHADDLKMISNVIHKIVKERKGKVIFETMGMTKHELAGVFPFEEFSAVCPHCGYEGELHNFPGESLDNYSIVLASKGWDIALAPVINNSFGNAKSDIKIKEYSALNIPVVASPVVPYKEASMGGANIVFAENFKEWYNEINDLINHPSKRDEMVKNNKEWVSGYWIQNNVHKIFDVYKQVLKKADLYKNK